MNAENVVGHLRALWRADRIIADLRLRQLAVGLGLKAFAALIAAFGLLAIELAAYFWLVQSWSAIAAAGLLGLANFVIAALLLWVASRPHASRELALASEVHAAAIEALQREARTYRSWDAVATLLPLVTPIIIGTIKRSRTQPSSSESSEPR